MMPPAKTSARKPRHRRRTTHTSSDDESELRREARSSSESSDGSDSDTLSSSEEDALDTPVPPVSPRAKKHKTSIIPGQPTSWAELVDETEGAEPPIIDFADFVENGVAALDSSGPSQPANRARGRGAKRGGSGGKTQRQAYLDKLSEDPSFIPRVGAFWGHDERLLAPELRGMSDWWRGKRGGGRGRARARGIGPQSASGRPTPDPQPSAATERIWGHDGFEKLKERDQDRRGRARGRGRGASRPMLSREPEQLWTKAPDTHLHIDPSTRPQFPGQGKGIKVHLPGQWRPEIVRVPRGQPPPASRVVKPSPVEVPAEIVVKLPGKPAKVVTWSPPAPVKEEPETVQPLEEPAPKPVARIPVPAPKSAFPVQVLNQPPLAHNRSRSQQDAVAFAHFRSPTVPAAPILFGSVDMPALNPGSAPPPETQPLPDETTPKIQPPASAPLPSGSTPLPPIPQTSTPPVANYYNPYAYTPLDGATYYSTATPPPPPHMYYPPNAFFVPPRPNASITIRAPGNGVPIHPARENGQDDRTHPPVWNYYPHGHNPYYSPSGTPYPGYYPEYAHGHGYEYGGVYY
ncbi:CASC3/barentsz eIF4AIII-binding protein [Rhizoctonia solani 123E]|uniref:CASC3/barentsz eIF4AIII-binding protein n=1 Tax=Rhizoctonia solani 123E TaxID=1423351 RepID=A0A074S0Q6_9AGAM|nr:CASC3/barentsz eIF4AIII-binding protein [Rhizoctonia solani 123E]